MKAAGVRSVSEGPPGLAVGACPGLLAPHLNSRGRAKRISRREAREGPYVRIKLPKREGKRRGKTWNVFTDLARSAPARACTN